MRRRIRCRSEGRRSGTRGSTCTKYWFRGSQAICEGSGGAWLNNVCRGRWRWNPEAPASSAYNYRDNCTRCHNQRYMNYEEAGLGETFVMTGHKNMLRPVAPLGNTDPHYTTTCALGGLGRLGLRDRLERQPDRLRDRDDRLVGGVTKTLYWIYDGWIAETPRSLASGGRLTPARAATRRAGARTRR